MGTFDVSKEPGLCSSSSKCSLATCVALFPREAAQPPPPRLGGSGWLSSKLVREDGVFMRSRNDERLVEEEAVEKESVRIVSGLSREGRRKPSGCILLKDGIRGVEGKGERV